VLAFEHGVVRALIDENPRRKNLSIQRVHKHDLLLGDFAQAVVNRSSAGIGLAPFLNTSLISYDPTGGRNQ
jgi:hypothetical protein